MFQRGECFLDAAFGMARDGVPMTPSSVMAWFSAGKPLTAVAVARLVERGVLTWETPVAEVIPEFAQQGKQAVTIHHLLTHTAGLRHADAIDAGLPWAEQIAQICALPFEPDWAPGRRAGYHLWSTWQLLAEVVRRLSGSPIEVVVRDEVLRPLGMNDSWLVPEASAWTQWSERLAVVYDTSAGVLQPHGNLNDAAALRRCRPGGGLRGPVRDLARFYEALRRSGEGVLRADTIAVMTARHRQGMMDETFQFRTDCGYGFILNSNRDGFQMPYGYGRHASWDTFGHSGNQSSCAFLDPRHELVVAWACNGLPGERRHQQRQRAVHDALHLDLGLAGGGQWSEAAR